MDPALLASSTFHLNWFHAALLGLIQGLAELLPVSSSAHVILVQHLLGLDPSRPEMVFLLVMLHTGTMGAVLYYFRERWVQVLSQNFRSWLLFTVAALGATAVVGWPLKALVEKIILGGGDHVQVEDLFRSKPAVALALTAAGTLILFSGLLSKRSQRAPRPLGLISSLWIGAIQGLCLPFRGFSRSGATISTALLAGLEKQTAEDFSFWLALWITPPVILRSAWKLQKSLALASSQGVVIELSQVLGPATLGALSAFLAGLLGLRFLSHLLERGSWWVFGLYCYGVALIMNFWI